LHAVLNALVALPSAATAGIVTAAEKAAWAKSLLLLPPLSLEECAVGGTNNGRPVAGCRRCQVHLHKDPQAVNSLSKSMLLILKQIAASARSRAT